MPTLVDTTIRLIGQEPLAGLVPTAEQLRVAEILDTAGFAYLEVSGGGCFESAVRRGVESPWARIRSLQPHVAHDLVTSLADASGLPVGIYIQGAGGSGLASALAAAQAGAQVIACAVYPLAMTVHRVSGEALSEVLTGIGLDPGVDVA